MLKHLKRLREFILYDMEIYKKIIMLVIIFVILPVLIITCVYYVKLGEVTRNELISSYLSTADQYIDNINYKLNAYSDIAENIAINKNIMEIFSEQFNYDTSEFYSLSREMQEQVNTISGYRKRGTIYNITVYSLDSNFPADGYSISNVNAIENEDWYLTRDLLNESSVFYGETHGQEETISMTRPMRRNNVENLFEHLGFVKVDVKRYNIFNRNLYGNSDHLLGLFFVTPENEMVYTPASSKLDMDQLDFQALCFNGEGCAIEKIVGKKSIVIRKSIYDYHVDGIFVFSYATVNTKLFKLGLFLSSFYLLFLSSFVVLMNMIAMSYTRRLTKLIEKMDKTSDERISQTQRIKGKDEIGRLDTQFNIMTERLSQLIYENYIRELQKKQTELEAFQFQINPHFLFNTLQSIDTFAQKCNCKEIYEINQCLGNMFRYNMSFEGREHVELEKEIEHIRNYLHIQEIRFGDKISSFIDIPDELNERRILRFILQPLVENSISHGLMKKQNKGVIEIVGETVDGNMLLTVEDDGVGMSQNAVHDLLRYINDGDDMIPHAFTKSVGIKNVNARLKIAYGEEYALKIQSKDGSGTRITITIPLE